MKMIILAMTLLLSATGFARQYTQCSDSTSELYSVINLPTLEKGTLFVTLGAETDTHKLYDIVKTEEKADGIHYKLIGGIDDNFDLIFPKNVFGTNSDGIVVNFHNGSHLHKFSCFTRVYND